MQTDKETVVVRLSGFAQVSFSFWVQSKGLGQMPMPPFAPPHFLPGQPDFWHQGSSDCRRQFFSSRCFKVKRPTLKEYFDASGDE